jgi:flagellar hook-associated protein 2
MREKTLRAQFNAMESALGTMKSQSNWLAGQIAGLSSQS